MQFDFLWNRAVSFFTMLIEASLVNLETSRSWTFQFWTTRHSATSYCLAMRNWKLSQIEWFWKLQFRSSRKLSGCINIHCMLIFTLCSVIFLLSSSTILCVVMLLCYYFFGFCFCGTLIENLWFIISFVYVIHQSIHRLRFTIHHVDHKESTTKIAL